MPELQQILKTALMHEDCGWNMGSFGAIGEFHHVYGDPAMAAILEAHPHRGLDRKRVV